MLWFWESSHDGMVFTVRRVKLCSGICLHTREQQSPFCPAGLLVKGPNGQQVFGWWKSSSLTADGEPHRCRATAETLNGLHTLNIYTDSSPQAWLLTTQYDPPQSLLLILLNRDIYVTQIAFCPIRARLLFLCIFKVFTRLILFAIKMYHTK